MTDVFTSVTLTRAVGIAPPPESVTVPSKVALTACPNEHVAVQSASAKRLTHKSGDQRDLRRAPRHFRDSIRPSDRRQYTPEVAGSQSDNLGAAQSTAEQERNDGRVTLSA